MKTIELSTSVKKQTVFQNRFKKDQQYGTIVIKNVKNKTFENIFG